jgi:hypothetical protein
MNFKKVLVNIAVDQFKSRPSCQLLLDYLNIRQHWGVTKLCFAPSQLNIRKCMKKHRWIKKKTLRSLPCHAMP